MPLQLAPPRPWWEMGPGVRGLPPPIARRIVKGANIRSTIPNHSVLRSTYAPSVSPAQHRLAADPRRGSPPSSPDRRATPPRPPVSILSLYSCQLSASRPGNPAAPRAALAQPICRPKAYRPISGLHQLLPKNSQHCPKKLFLCRTKDKDGQSSNQKQTFATESLRRESARRRSMPTAKSSRPSG